MPTLSQCRSEVRVYVFRIFRHGRQADLHGETFRRFQTDDSSAVGVSDERGLR